MKHYKYSFILLFVFSLVSPLRAQNSYKAGTILGLDYLKKFEKGWFVNPQIFNRVSIGDGQLKNSELFDQNIGYVLTDVDVFFGKQINEHWKSENAFLVRFQDKEVIFRFIQGMVWKKKFPKWTMSQRFRIDENYGVHIKPIYRMRYRLGGQIPAFKKAKKGKWDFSLTTELVNKFQSNIYVGEFRLVPLFIRTRENKDIFDIGLDYRLNHVLSKEENFNNLWVIFTYKFR